MFKLLKTWEMSMKHDRVNKTKKYKVDKISSKIVLSVFKKKG
jgi:hypothetical protein